jgi:hypothetical protein
LEGHAHIHDALQAWRQEYPEQPQQAHRAEYFKESLKKFRSLEFFNSPQCGTPQRRAFPRLQEMALLRKQQVHDAARKII